MRISDWSSDVCPSDLFILLSGFLMMFQYRLRAGREDWNAPGTWTAFWTRRFFRLAPLFYVTLAAALIAGPSIYADRVVIDSFLGQSLQPPERRSEEHTSELQSLMRISYAVFC